MKITIHWGILLSHIVAVAFIIAVFFGVLEDHWLWTAAFLTLAATVEVT